jgi:ferredoxin-nitrite reductase
MADSKAFTAEQQNYLQGFALGVDVARKVQGLPVIAGSAAGGAHSSRSATVTLGPPNAASTVLNFPDRLQWEAQDRQVANGGQLCPE